ncbi:DMT family transporter [Roseovarius nubinhibens]|uniref:DMT family transporter n=1 Tax=Roseovarius nubinhibens TaxID=314263 RepID=UPI001C080CA2|nr:DMT family transporter [Roseovarius nubinhibens]MBU2999782.1 DMT family transporter [Roseovarius nubinhibens]
MTGEAFAVLAALAYGVAGVAIVQGRPKARGDNGVFLSVLLTAALSCLLWLGWGGTTTGAQLAPRDLTGAILIFAVAGICSNGIGRQAMYWATERIGAVRAGLLRRLTPLFVLPCAYLLLGEVPAPQTLLGSALVLAGVLIYVLPQTRATTPVPDAPPQISANPFGLMLGTLSALAYALAFALRGLGLDLLPDPTFGAMIGAFAGALALLALALARKGLCDGLRHLSRDRQAAHWLTALGLSAGQILQFFALHSAPVVSVALLGTLEVMFSAAIILLITKGETVALRPLILASILSTAGTAILLFA